MLYRRAIIKVSVRLDPLPGFGHSAEDFAEIVRKSLEVVPHYKPEVTIEGVIDEKVICSEFGHCNERRECGGAMPHDYDTNECGRCPKDSAAVCIAVGDLE